MSREFWEKNAKNWTQAVRSQMTENRKVTHPAIIQEILRWNPQSVLDLGCGEGWIGSQLVPRGIQYVGLDFSQALFDEHLDDLLREVTRHLKPSGTLLIQTLHPCFTIQPYESGWRTEDFKTFPLPFEGEIRWYARTLSTWMELFSKNDLKVKAITEPLHLTNRTPLSLIFSLAERD